MTGRKISLSHDRIIRMFLRKYHIRPGWFRHCARGSGKDEKHPDRQILAAALNHHIIFCFFAIRL